MLASFYSPYIPNWSPLLRGNQINLLDWCITCTIFRYAIQWVYNALASLKILLFRSESIPEHSREGTFSWWTRHRRWKLMITWSRGLLVLVGMHPFRYFGGRTIEILTQTYLVSLEISCAYLVSWRQSFAWLYFDSSTQAPLLQSNTFSLVAETQLRLDGHHSNQKLFNNCCWSSIGSCWQGGSVNARLIIINNYLINTNINVIYGPVLRLWYAYMPWYSPYRIHLLP